MMTDNRQCVISFPMKAAQCAVILNGQRTSLSEYDFSHYGSIIVTDGAWNDFSRIVQLDSDQSVVVLGDGDSIVDAPDGFIHTPDQNFTDFEKALQHAQQQSVQSIDVFWGCGGDVDHQLGNLSVAAKMCHSLDVRFINGQQYCFYLPTGNEKLCVTGVKKATVSLYPFPTAVISSAGLQYPLQEMALDLIHQQSLRNEASADTVEIYLHDGSCWVFVGFE